MKIFPLGTSRIHEPLKFSHDRSLMSFPGIGFFHSPSQILDILEFIYGSKKIDIELARFFFRKDGTKENPFDRSVWDDQESLDAVMEKIKRLYFSSDSLIIEISSLRSFSFRNCSVQGNPNYYRNIPYSEIWKLNYYHLYHSELDVAEKQDDEALEPLIKKLLKIQKDENKSILIVGHLIDPQNPNKTRLQLNSQLENAVKTYGETSIKYYDARELVSRYGFRVLTDTKVDIAHIPLTALEEQARIMEELLNTAIADEV